MSIRTTLIALACGIAATAGQPALALAQADVVRPAPNGTKIVIRSETISYRDLDLSSKAGVQALLQRIRKTARRLCASSPTIPQNPAPYRKCVDAAVARAVQDVNSPQLASLISPGG